MLESLQPHPHPFLPETPSTSSSGDTTEEKLFSIRAKPPCSILTGRPTSPGRPGSPDSPGSPCRGEKRMNVTFLQVAEFAADVAKPLHECCSKLLQASITFVWMLYLLSYCSRISYSTGRTLWTICSWWSRWTSGSRWAWWALREIGDKFKRHFLEQCLCQ